MRSTAATSEPCRWPRDERSISRLARVAGSIARKASGAERSEAWRWFWQAFAHAVVAARLVPAAAPLVLRPWPALVEAALASDDEHVVKLVEAAQEEEQAHGGDDWQRAASRAVMTVR